MNLVASILCVFSLLSYSFCIDITTDVFGTSTQYLPAAFGDFNADKLTDMFVIENLSNGSCVVKTLLSYSTSPILRPTGPYCKFETFKVKSIIPSDFDGDGAMDLLLISLEGRKHYNAHVLWGNLKTLECLGKTAILASFKSQPLLMDYNGDMISDLFGEDLEGNRAFWVFGSERKEPVKILLNLPQSTPLPHLKMSGGHAFVDVDNDLAADLWVSAEGQFEFWSSAENFQYYEVIDHPRKNDEAFKVIGQSTFLDIDLDGNIEVIVPVCVDENCADSAIYVHEFSNGTSTWYNVNVNLKDAEGVTWSFPSGKAYKYTETITPRIGDLNMDGYPDILITVFKGNTPKVIQLINSKCDGDCDYPRIFIPQFNVFDAWPNSVLGTFFDFLEDGTLDILLVNGSLNGNYTVGAYKDPMEYDAMFLKVLVVTGVCYENCSHHSIPYGTNQPGPSITYSITSAAGSLQKARATQLSQSSHFALQLPFVILGLGRNWNFIDNLQIGIPLSNNIIESNNSMTIGSSPFTSAPLVQKAIFSQIIPNSQLVVVPFPKNKPNQWITKIFITPSKAMILTAGSLIATCLFVGAIIAALHYIEKKEDKRERRQQAQRFHFDAM